MNLWIVAKNKIGGIVFVKDSQKMENNVKFLKSSIDAYNTIKTFKLGLLHKGLFKLISLNFLTLSNEIYY